MQRSGARAEVAALCLLAALGALGCAAPARSNLLLIVVDTLRADHLGCYGYTRDTSPAIDALAAQGVRFGRAYAAASWTKPSVASLLTGLHPAALGIDNIFSRLPASADTLAEILASNGYRTAGVVSHVMLSNQWDMGFGQGFASYDESEARGHTYVSTPGVTERAIERLRALARDEAPFLLFVHYFDPHFEYRDHAEVGWAQPRSPHLVGNENIVTLRAKLAELDERDFRFLRDRYDEEIRVTDAGVGRLLAALADLGLDDDTVVVFTADHGEELGEQGWLGHTPSLAERVVHVPLIVRAPGAAGPRVVDTPVSLVSLVPSALDLLGVPAGDREFHGRSFASAVRGETAGGDDEPAPVLVEIDFPLQDPRISPVRLLKHAWVGERFKLVADDAAGTTALFDLREDPGEERDLAAQRPELRDRLLRELRQALARARAGAPEPQHVELSEEELRLLEHLGYVKSAEGAGGVSPDRRP